jgi:hypothetical protein
VIADIEAIYGKVSSIEEAAEWTQRNYNL